MRREEDDEIAWVPLSPIAQRCLISFPVEQAPLGLTGVDKRRGKKWLFLSYRRFPRPARDAL
jgi:hypothetical protein